MDYSVIQFNLGMNLKRFFCFVKCRQTMSLMQILRLNGNSFY